MTTPDITTRLRESAGNSAFASLVEAMQGIAHFRDAIAYRDDTLSVALRQWIDAGENALSQVEGSEVNGWQPIETAPKDGTGILVIDMTAQAPEAGPAWFMHGVWTAVYPGGAVAIDRETYRAMTWPTPTHWMPLPTPPSQIEEGKDHG